MQGSAGNNMQKIIIALLIILAILSAVEMSFFIKAYLDADTVKCNLLWCEFTTVKRNMTMDCFENGQRINCTSVEDINLPTGVW